MLTESAFWSGERDDVEHRHSPRSGGTFRGRAKPGSYLIGGSRLRVTFPASATDFAHYTSDAHAQAVRTVLACRPGATVIVNLPTGAGKSTVALAPALARAQPAGVSVIVVPTVALALDQERRVRELLGDPDGAFAYSASTPDDVRIRMRANIRTGLQRLIFVAPESITRSLAPALFVAAREGLLRYFIVDEAHLIDQWGTEFRPDFQAMAGLRLELLHTAVDAGREPFRTVMMTATMPPSTADLLVDLFGTPGPLEPAIANSLRPEPAYFTASCAGVEKRTAAVVDAVRHLPRPLIVYSSRPAYAEHVAAALRAAGFRRVALFTGESTDDERRGVLANFRDWSVDVVCATSAFGLGVDQHDIRSVVHACIPETIDRYYQEVGRAGRDGHPSLSLVLWTEGDRKDAWAFSHPRLITSTLGLDRWRTMLSTGEGTTTRDGQLSLPLAALRSGLERYTDENTKWNIRLLGLLVRAGVLCPGWDVPEVGNWDPTDVVSRGGGEFDDDRRMVVELVKGALDETMWAEIVEPARDRVRDENDRAHQAMLDALKPEAATCELIRSAYDLGLSKRLDQRRHHGRPTLACGGCPAHPEGRPSGLPPMMAPVGRALDPTVTEPSPLVQRGVATVVTYAPPVGRRHQERLNHDVVELLRILVPAGIRMLIGPQDLVADPQVARFTAEAHLQVSDRMFLVEPEPDGRPDTLDWLPAVAAVVVSGPGKKVPKDWFDREPDDPALVLIVPDSHPDPDRADRTITELRAGVRSLSALTRS